MLEQLVEHQIVCFDSASSWLAEFAELRTWIKAFRVCYYHYSQSSPNRDNTTWC